ncbi:MAG: redoxin domain-containing protein [Planctomycetes bacterium]|nr:redoxin domain-containing protein [Planctomycetota bacterium]
MTLGDTLTRIKLAIALLVLLAAGQVDQPEDSGKSDITIDNLSLGQLLMGEPVDKEDLRDRVVAIEFWGINCGPCRASIPDMVKYVKKYSPSGFVLIGIHRQNEPADKVTSFCKSQKINYPIYQQGDISGVSFSGIPHFCVFNHRGELVFDGHPARAGKKLDETVKNAPDPLVGEGPYKKLSALAGQIAKSKNYGNIMGQLKKKSESADADEKAEAEKLLARLNNYAQRQKTKADAFKDTEPLQHYDIYKGLSEQFKGDEIGTQADKVLNDLKNDQEFQKSLKAEREWLKIEEIADKLKPCQIDEPLDPKNCQSCKKKNDAALGSITSGCKYIIKQYHGTPAARKCEDLMSELGLSDK